MFSLLRSPSSDSFDQGFNIGRDVGIWIGDHLWMLLILYVLLSLCAIIALLILIRRRSSTP